MRFLACMFILFCLTSSLKAANIPELETRSFRFVPLDDQKSIPKRYRLKESSFDYTLKKKQEMPAVGITVSTLTFPSPVKTEVPENNTVHALYYRPEGDGPFPGIIVLDITGGNQLLSRFLSTHLARHRIACLFVQMAYYGPRRPPGSKLRLLTPNIKHTTAAFTQTVLDLRVATAWLASRPEIDSNRLGILGTSLGSFLSALTGEMEPRLNRVCVLLGGGGFVDGYATHPLAGPYIKLFEAFGGKRDEIKKLIEPIDPLTCAANLKQRKLLMMAARNDEVVPPVMAKMLWEASGKQKILWYNAGHYTAAMHIADALPHIIKHFKE